jgi:hypothetical protein
MKNETQESHYKNSPQTQKVKTLFTLYMVPTTINTCQVAHFIIIHVIKINLQQYKKLCLEKHDPKMSLQ